MLDRAVHTGGLISYIGLVEKDQDWQAVSPIPSDQEGSVSPLRWRTRGKQPARSRRRLGALW